MFGGSTLAPEMSDTSRFRAIVFVGLLTGALAACTLAGSDIDHYNSGDGKTETKDPSPTPGKTDGGASEGGGP